MKMNLKNKLSKLFSYSNVRTAIRHCNGNSDLITAVKKHYLRIERNEKTVHTVRQFCDNLIEKRLNRIAEALPDDGYSMGSYFYVRAGKITGRWDNASEYAKSSRYRANHGHVEITIKLSELRNYHVIGGLITYIYPGPKTATKKCFWFEGVGKKQHFCLKKVEGYINDGSHSTDKKKCSEQAKTRHMNTFETKLIKDTFSKCFGLQSCLKSVRTQNDAIISLSERTGLRIEHIKFNLETICNL